MKKITLKGRTLTLGQEITLNIGSNTKIPVKGVIYDILDHITAVFGHNDIGKKSHSSFEDNGENPNNYRWVLTDYNTDWEYTDIVSENIVIDDSPIILKTN